MPYSVPDGGIVECIFEGRVLGQQMISVFHYQLDLAGGSTDGGVALDALKVQLNAAGGPHAKYMSCMSQQYNTGRIRLQWILPDRYAYREYLPTNTDGQAPTDVVAPNAAAAINKRSDLAGIHGHGVTHMPAVSIDFVTAGEINAAGLLAYVDFAEQMKTDMVTIGSGTYHPIIYNRATPGDVVFITGYAIDNVLRVMRRRTVGVGS